MSFRFKPEDFRKPPGKEFNPSLAADLANQLLDEHIATLPEVKGWNQDDDLNTVIWFPKKNADYQSTHRARLWGLEEIKQKKCEHVVVDVKYSKMMRGVEGWIGKCEKCGRLMTPKWEEV